MTWKPTPTNSSTVGDDPSLAGLIADMTEQLNAWYRQHHTRTTISDAQVEKRVGGDMRRGIYVGFWNDEELAGAKQLGRSGN